jgi:hypothetical protein
MVLVGAPQAGTVGAAYLFDVGTGTLLHTFADPTSGLGDYFGGAIATMGDNVLIGASMNAYGYPAGSGAAYLFTHNTGQGWDSWTLSQTYTGTAGAEFGSCVASVGNRFVIGAPGENQSSGAVYCYGSPTSAPSRIADPSNTPGDCFGTSVAVAGSTTVVGAPNSQSNNGAVYEYDGLALSGARTGGAGELLGDSVALMGSNILVGAPYNQTSPNQGGAAYVLAGSDMSVVHEFDNPHQGPGYDGIGARFGSFVVPVGNNILVSAPWDDAAGAGTPGAAYLFDGATYDTLLTMTGNPSPPSVYPGDNFGHGPSAMGDDILVGAPYADDLGVPNSGAAYLIQGVPEPSTLALLAGAVVGLIGWAWRRKVRKA